MPSSKVLSREAELLHKIEFSSVHSLKLRENVFVFQGSLVPFNNYWYSTRPLLTAKSLLLNFLLYEMV